MRAQLLSNIRQSQKAVKRSRHLVRRVETFMTIFAHGCNGGDGGSRYRTPSVAFSFAAPDAPTTESESRSKRIMELRNMICERGAEDLSVAYNQLGALLRETGSGGVVTESAGAPLSLFGQEQGQLEQGAGRAQSWIAEALCDLQCKLIAWVTDNVRDCVLLIEDDQQDLLEQSVDILVAESSRRPGEKWLPVSCLVRQKGPSPESNQPLPRQITATVKTGSGKSESKHASLEQGTELTSFGVGTSPTSSFSVAECKTLEEMTLACLEQEMLRDFADLLTGDPQQHRDDLLADLDLRIEDHHLFVTRVAPLFPSAFGIGAFYEERVRKWTTAALVKHMSELKAGSRGTLMRFMKWLRHYTDTEWPLLYPVTDSPETRLELLEVLSEVERALLLETKLFVHSMFFTAPSNGSGLDEPRYTLVLADAFTLLHQQAVAFQQYGCSSSVLERLLALVCAESDSFE
jgi:hypothetical protein